MHSKKWLSRHSFPAIKKLNLQFDINQIRKDLVSFEAENKWNGLSDEFSNLCEIYTQLPPFFLKSGESPNEYASYQQLSLSKFDDHFQLKNRTELSGSLWDKISPQNNKFADERFYRAPKENIPTYLNSILNYFRPYLHRVRFAKLLPNSSVQPHIDYDTRYSCRLHIPIYTSLLCKKWRSAQRR